MVNDLGVATDGTGSSRVADEVVAAIAQLGGEAVANYDSVATVEGGQRIVPPRSTTSARSTSWSTTPASCAT